MRSMPRPGEGLTDQQRHLAEHIASGHTLKEAKALAGYIEGSSLYGKQSIVHNDNFKYYLFYLREQAAERTYQSIDLLVRQLDDARILAMVDRDPGAVVNAVMAKAKLLGMIGAEKHEIELNVINKPSSIPTNVVDLSLDEWKEKHAPKAIQ